MDGKDQTLYCEGICKQWFHRYCAGIPSSWFEKFSTTTSPFLCYSCSQQNHADCITKLTESVSSLRSEINELKIVLNRDKAASNNMSPLCAGNQNVSLSAFDDRPSLGSTQWVNHHGGFRYGSGRGGRGRGGRNMGGGGTRRGVHESLHVVGLASRKSKSGGSRGTADMSETSANCSQSGSHARCKVDGARRVWGTLSLCSSGAVQNAIKRICGITSIRVKRKEKELAGGKKQWWFVIHDDEDILCALDAKWNLIEVQTSWKLESCYRPISSDSHSSTINLKHSAIVEEAVQPADKVPEHDSHSSTDNSHCESHSSSVSAVSSTHCHAFCFKTS